MVQDLKQPEMQSFPKRVEILAKAKAWKKTKKNRNGEIQNYLDCGGNQCDFFRHCRVRDKRRRRKRRRRRWRGGDDYCLAGDEVREKDIRQLPIIIVTIRASLCGKCTTDASKLENEIDLLGANMGQLAP